MPLSTPRPLQAGQPAQDKTRQDRREEQGAGLHTKHAETPSAHHREGLNEIRLPHVETHPERAGHEERRENHQKEMMLSGEARREQHVKDEHTGINHMLECDRGGQQC